MSCPAEGDSGVLYLSLSFNPLVVGFGLVTACRHDVVRHRLIIFGFLPQISKTRAVAVGVSVQQSSGLGEQARSARLDGLAAFRCVFYDCLTLRADALLPRYPRHNAAGPQPRQRR
jgi:hypothetical protein